jgi:RNA polymerase sigma-70 factor (ECF subfamily)
LDFEEIYLSWFSRMKHFAKEYVIREEDAENIVQDVFMELWGKRPILVDRTRLAAYLFTAVKKPVAQLLAPPCHGAGSDRSHTG